MKKDILSRYIRGRASEKEQAAVLRWTEESADNLATYRFLHGIYAASLMEDSCEKESVPEKVSAGLSRPVRRAPYALAFACIAVVAGIFLFRPKEPVSVQSVCAPVGQQTKVDLSDGTTVWLNSGSSIEFGDLDKQKVRQVRLTGEAFFSVAGDPKRPFIVHTPEFRVKVLGTRFNVNTYNEIKTVVLVEGSVDVLRGRDRFSITPGEMFSWDSPKAESRISEVATDNYVSWVNGYLLFENIPLGEVLSQLQSFFGVNFSYDPARAASTHISGKLELRDGLDTALLNLKNTTILSYERDGDKSVRIRIND